MDKIPNKKEILASLGYYSDDYQFLELVNGIVFNYLKEFPQFNDKYNR
jgi:hypothetical protein